MVVDQNQIQKETWLKFKPSGESGNHSRCLLSSDVMLVFVFLVFLDKMVFSVDHLWFCYLGKPYPPFFKGDLSILLPYFFMLSLFRTLMSPCPLVRVCTLSITLPSHPRATSFLSTCRRSVLTRWSSTSPWVHMPPHLTPSSLHPGALLLLLCSLTPCALKGLPVIHGYWHRRCSGWAFWNRVVFCRRREDRECLTERSVASVDCRAEASSCIWFICFCLHRKWRAPWLRNTCDLSSLTWVMCLKCTFDRGIKLSDIIEKLFMQLASIGCGGVGGGGGSASLNLSSAGVWGVSKA